MHTIVNHCQKWKRRSDQKRLLLLLLLQISRHIPPHIILITILTTVPINRSSGFSCHKLVDWTFNCLCLRPVTIYRYPLRCIKLISCLSNSWSIGNKVIDHGFIAFKYLYLPFPSIPILDCKKLIKICLQEIFFGVPFTAVIYCKNPIYRT